MRKSNWTWFFEPVDGVTFLQGDFRDEEMLTRLEQVLGGQPVKVWRGRVVSGSGAPGQIVAG